MLEKLIEKCAENRLLVIVLMAMLSGAGVWAASNTAVDAIPDLSDVQVIIKTDYPGQSPRIVEEQVTYPLSTAMLAVPDAKTVRAYSMFGASFVYVIFEDGTDMYWARSRVLEYLNQVAGMLPEAARPAIGPDATGVGWVYQYSVRDTTGRHDLADLRTIQDFFLKYELQSVEGVAEVAPIGGFVRQYQVVVDPHRMSAHGISIDHVRQRLARSNEDVGGRLMEIAGKEFIIQGRGYFKSLDDIRQVALRARDGSVVTVDEVATIRTGPDIRRGIAESNGEGEVVGGVVVMRYGENALRVIERVRQRLDELRPGLPAGVTIETEYDRSRLIERSVSTLTTKLWQEMLIVALVVALFLLHVRSAFVAVITIPVGILIALTVMKAFGINANIMSLGGIAISIGVMVDASLVMVENAHKHLERVRSSDSDSGITRDVHFRAVVDAAREVGPSLFFSLLVVTVSFLPIFTLEQIEGRLFRPLAFTSTFSMAAAAILSVTLVPSLMVLFVRGRIRKESENPISRFFIGGYRPVIRWILKRPWTTLAVAGLLAAVSVLPVQRLLFGETYVPFTQIGSEFMPPLYEGDLLYMPSTLPGVSPQRAGEILQQTDRILASFPEVDRVFGKIGRAETATDPAPLSMVETTVILKPESEWREGMTHERLVEEMDEALQIPGLSNIWTMPIRNRIDMLATGINTPVGIKLAGPDLDTLQQIGSRLENMLQSLEGSRSVFAERATTGSFIDIEINRFEATRHGLTTGDVQDVIRTALGGMNVSTFVDGLKRFPINIRYPERYRNSLSDLRDLLVPLPAGGHVPLGQLATLRPHEAASMIKSENARPNVWVFVDLEAGQDLGSYVARARRIVATDLDLPPGYSLKWSGQFEFLERASARLRILVPLTLMLIFLLLYLHFRRIAETSILMVTLPFAIVGAIWLQVMLDYNMSIAVAVGMIAVAGLAAETGVVMLVYLDEAVARYRREGRLQEPNGLLRALEEGAVDRVRPKLMTVVTTILALMPVMLSAGTGSEIMRPIAAPMVGGLVTSTLLTLLVIPAAYVLLHRFRMRRSLEGADIIGNHGLQ